MRQRYEPENSWAFQRCTEYTIHTLLRLTLTFLCFPLSAHVCMSVCIFHYAMAEKRQLDTYEYVFAALLFFWWRSGTEEGLLKLFALPILIMCYILLYFIHYIIVWHAHTNMLSTIFAFAFAFALLSFTCPCPFAFEISFPSASSSPDIACTFCCYSFHISYIHNTWFHLNHFLANCGWSYSDCNRTGMYCMRMWKTKSIEWANHLSETLRNKCYFIHLYSNFSIIITVSVLLSVYPCHYV